MYISIGGIEQWIQFNEGESELPILLYLHGGPGASSLLAAAAWKTWEEHFTVVHWDQRGAGRTLRKNGEAGCGRLTMDGMVSDGIEIAEFLITRLQKPKVLLVGHSWGSALAVHMLKRRPDLFSAFVGTGQLVNMQQNEEFNYRRQMEQAKRAANQEAIDALRSIGPPPYSDITSLGVLREWADRLVESSGDSVLPRPNPMPADFTRDDVSVLKEGVMFSVKQLYEDFMAIDLRALGLRFDVPMFFFHGACDQQTPVELAERYCDDIVAPHKEFVRFEGCHHFVVMNRPADFLRELVYHVCPLI